MAENVGRVELLVDANGKALPNQIRNIGRKAGRAGGLELSKGFQDALSRLGREMQGDMQEHGELSGISFTDSFQRALRARAGGISDELAAVFSRKNGLDSYAKRVGGVEPALDSLRDKMRELNEIGGLNNTMWGRLGGTLNQWAGEARKAESAASALAEAEDRSRKHTEEINRAHGEAIVIDRQRERGLSRLAAAQERAQAAAARAVGREERLAAVRANASRGLDRYAKDTDKAGKSNDRFGGGLGHNTKQVIFWSSAIAAASGNIGALGSAAGSSLAVLTGAALSTGIGVGVAVAAFRGLSGEIGELPASVRPAAEAFQALGGIFDELQDKLQITAMADMAPRFEALGGLVERLTPAFDTVAGAVNRVLQAFTDALTSAAGFETLNTLIGGSGEVFEGIALGAGSLLAALGQVLAVGMPFIQQFADGFAELMEQFNEWTRSAEGNLAITRFFEHGQQLMGPFLDLIGEVGKMLASLVTPETIQMTVDFINNLSEFMPVLGDILGVIAELDAFGVLSELLLAIGEALTPVLPQLGDLAGLLRDFLIDAFRELAPILAEVLTALAPVALEMAQNLLPAVVDLLPVIGDLVMTVLPPLVDIFIALLPAIEAIVGILGEVLPPVLDAVNPIIEELAGVLELVANIISDVLMGHLDGLSKFLSGDLTGSVLAFGDMWENIWGHVSEFFTEKFEKMQKDARRVSDDINNFFRDMPGRAGAALAGLVDIVLRPFRDISPGVSRIVDDIVGFFRGLPGRVLSMVGFIGAQIADRFRFSLPDIPGVPAPFASGGLVSRATNAIIGEAGPELIVPLRRPLSQVDPAARELSAIAQGLRPSAPVAAAAGKQTIIAEGAITVIAPSADPELVASSMLDRIVQDL